MSQFGLPDPNDNVLEDDSAERFYKLHSVAPSPIHYSILTLLLGQLFPALDGYVVIKSTPPPLARCLRGY